MIILPAIDLHDGSCVRLMQGDYATAEKVAESPVKAASYFESEGAHWLHMVDLDGAKFGRPVNDQSVFDVLRQVHMKVELGGGIRDMKTVEYYLEKGVSRIILGSVALKDPAFVREAVKKYGKRIAVGIDAKGGKVAAEGWLQVSNVDYLDLAREMEQIGVRYIIFTDISKDGTMNGPNLDMLDRINREVSCNIIASGGGEQFKRHSRPQRAAALRRHLRQEHLFRFPEPEGCRARQPAHFRQQKTEPRNDRRYHRPVFPEERTDPGSGAGSRYRRRADAGVHEPPVPAQNAGNGLHLVFQPQPAGIME